MPGTILEVADAAGVKMDKGPCSHGAYIPMEGHKIKKTHRICQVEDDKAELESDEIGCCFRNGLQGKLFRSGYILAEVT